MLIIQTTIISDNQTTSFKWEVYQKFYSTDSTLQRKKLEQCQYIGLDQFSLNYILTIIINDFVNDANLKWNLRNVLLKWKIDRKLVGRMINERKDQISYLLEIISIDRFEYRSK